MWFRRPAWAYAWLILIMLFAGQAAWATPASAPGQPASIRVVMDEDYPPFIFRDASGALKGILVDQWKLWEARTGVKVQLDAYAWATAQRRMEAGQYDVIDTIFENPERRQRYDFSPPYARIDVPIFFSKDLSGISGPRDLAGFVVGVKRGDNAIEILKANGAANLKLFDSYDAIVAAARDGGIKVFAVDRPPALYHLIKLGIQDQFRATEPLYSGEFHRAVRKGDAALLAALARGFAAITPAEYQAIERRWYGAPLVSRRDLRLVVLVLAGILALVGLLLVWIWTLKRLVARRSAELQASYARNEEVLRTSEAQYRSLLHAIPDLLFTFDRRGTYLSVHASEPSLLAAPEREIVGRNLEDILPRDLAQRFREAIGEALDGGAVRELNYELTVSGQERAFQARVAPLGEDRAITVVRDVSDARRLEAEQRRLQAQLQQAQKLESLGSLAGGVAHDMNNVLGAILTIATGQQELLPEHDRARLAFETIAKAATRGSTMVKRLLNFTRQSPVQSQAVDLNAVARDVAELLERTAPAQIRLDLDLAPGPLPLMGDASALTHAVMNLCVNAVDAMEGGGTLTLRTRNLDGRAVGLAVEDTGAGMEPEVLQKALDPFFTTKETGKGTGLGLPMVYSIAMAHRGSMDLQSRPGEGTRVRLQFPVAGAPGQPAEPARPEPAPAHPSRPLRVLLVDDDVFLREAVEALLAAMGHAATEASGGEEALERLEAGLEPDLVILDMNMPGLGGAGTLPRIRDLRPSTPVLLITGKADQTAIDLAKAHPRVDLLPKPFTAADLRRHLGRLTG